MIVRLNPNRLGLFQNGKETRIETTCLIKHWDYLRWENRTRTRTEDGEETEALGVRKIKWGKEMDRSLENTHLQNH